MPQKITFAGFDITLSVKGSIMMHSLAKALRDPGFAKRVRCVHTSRFDGMIDGSRQINDAMSADVLAAECERKNPRAHGLGAYKTGNGFAIHVYDYCDSWEIIDRAEEIRRLEAIVALTDAWTINYHVTNGHYTNDARTLATRELRAIMHNDDAMRFDETISGLHGISDPMVTYVRIYDARGCFNATAWQPVATTTEVQA